MNKVKLFTVDLDGTLLDEDKNGKKVVSKFNIDSIIKAKENGIDVVISTGRVQESALLIADTIPTNYVIAGNGSQIFDPNRDLIFSEKMNVKQCLKILKVVQDFGLSLKPDNFYEAFGVNTFFQKKITKGLGWKINSWYTYPLLEERFKIIVFGSPRKSKMRKFKNEINKIEGLIALSSMNGFTVEITSEKATKGLAAEFLTKKLGLKKDEAAHIGDTMNDSTTKGHVGQLIVMKNGSGPLKKLATRIGPHYKNGGVGKIINEACK